MVTAHRQMQPLGVRIPAAFNLTDSPPIDVRGIPVLLVASDDAALAANTLCHVEMKPVLFSNFQGALRNSRNGLVNGGRAMWCADRVQLTFWREGEHSALFFRPF